MKFSAVPRTARAERKITLPKPHAASDSAPPVWLLLRPLNAGEDIDVLKAARSAALAAGAEARAGDPVYDRMLMAHTLALGCLDCDSSPLAREPFFEGGVDQILDRNGGLDPDVLVMLYEHHEVWQDECSVSITKVDTEALMDRLVAFAEAEDDRPFVELSPAMRVICMRTMARRLLDSLGSRSSRGSRAPRSTGTRRRRTSSK